jgi:hypothetical protein
VIDILGKKTYFYDHKLVVQQWAIGIVDEEIVFLYGGMLHLT